MKRIILLVLLFFAWKQYYYIESAPSVGAAILSGGGPFVSSSDLSSFREGDFTYSPRSIFEIDARVLEASHYYFDRMSRISPMDIVVGWNDLSDESVTDLIDFSIRDRDYSWELDNAPISSNDVAAQTELLHLIPKNGRIKSLMKTIKIGDVVVVRGYLVDVKSAAGLKWQTSGNRPGKGQTSGKLIYVTDLEIIAPYLRIN